MVMIYCANMLPITFVLLVCMYASVYYVLELTRKKHEKANESVLLLSQL